MLYEFQADDGTVIERSFSMREAPEIGATVMHQGKTYKRVISAPPVSGSRPGLIGEYDSNSYPKTSCALPQWCVGAEHVRGGRHDGRPIITSKSHERELCRMHGFTREYSPD